MISIHKPAILIFIIGAVALSLFKLNGEVNYAYLADARCSKYYERNSIREASCQRRDELRDKAGNSLNYSETAKINREQAIRYFFAGNMHDSKKDMMFWILDMGRAGRVQRAKSYLSFFKKLFLPDCASNAEVSPDLCSIYMTTAGELLYMSKEIERAREYFTTGIELEANTGTEFEAAALLGKQAILELKFGHSCVAERNANEAITLLSAFIGTSIDEYFKIGNDLRRAKKVSKIAQKRCAENPA